MSESERDRKLKSLRERELAGSDASGGGAAECAVVAEGEKRRVRETEEA